MFSRNAQLGIRREDRKRFHRWSDDLIAADGNLSDPQVMERAGRALREYGDYLTEIFEDRRKHPQDDLVSILVGAKDEGLLKNFDLESMPGSDGVTGLRPASANDAKFENSRLQTRLSIDES